MLDRGKDGLQLLEQTGPCRTDMPPRPFREEGWRGRRDHEPPLVDPLRSPRKGAVGGRHAPERLGEPGRLLGRRPRMQVALGRSDP
jgi:hypothetical protein